MKFVMHPAIALGAAILEVKSIYGKVSLYNPKSHRPAFPDVCLFMQWPQSSRLYKSGA